MKKLESIQQKTLCSLLEIPKTTPYIGLLNEIGMWTIEERMKYRRLMLYHNLVNSDDGRLCKRVVQEQECSGEVDTFFDTTKDMSNSLKINIDSIKTVEHRIIIVENFCKYCI